MIEIKDKLLYTVTHIHIAAEALSYCGERTSSIPTPVNGLEGQGSALTSCPNKTTQSRTER